MNEKMDYQKDPKAWDEALDKEEAFYMSLSDEWKQVHHGKYVLIQDQQIKGLYYCQRDGIRCSVEKLGTGVPFFFHKVGEENEPHSWVCHPAFGGEVCHPI